MAFSRYAVVLAATVITLAACAGGDDGTGPVLTRALSPPVDAPDPAPSTTTTTALLSPADADRLARTELSTVLAAAEEIYRDRGTFDADLVTVSALASGIAVTALVDAALSDGVAYDAHDQRLTLHRRSSSGRWFCVDVTDAGPDHGFGDSFDGALDACTDGVQVDGWEDAFSATGRDENAIKTVLANLVAALSSGDSRAAHGLFASTMSCTMADLEAAWPAGLALVDSAEYELRGVTMAGGSATAEVAFAEFSNGAWPLTREKAQWRLDTDPCDLIAPVAGELMDSRAGDLLEQGLFAVKSAFVGRSDFAFTAAAVSDLDGELLLVPSDEVTFGLLSYRGSRSEGLLVTRGSPGRFYCVVESLSATTVYGEGEEIADVDTPNRCRGLTPGNSPGAKHRILPTYGLTDGIDGGESMELPDTLKALLDGPNFAALATVMADGSPQASTMWVDREGDHIRFNTAAGRVKPANMDRDPRVAVSIFNSADPYESFSVQGRVVEKRLAGADAHIDALAKKYLGVDEYPYRVAGQIRITYVIEADQVAAH